MKKTYLILTAVLLLLLVPGANAWNWTTHRAVARAAYEELPENIKIHLNYNRIVDDGAVWPDRYRGTPDPYGLTFPSSGHIQPGSRAQAAYWLAEAGSRYWENDFDGASLALGIAAHYIADSVALVHNIGWTDLHEEFEEQGELFTPTKPAGVPDFNLEQKLTEYYNGAQAKWQRWLGTRDQTIAEEGVNLAASYTYNAWCQTLGTPLPEAQGVSSFVDFRLIAGIVLVILIVVIAVGMKRFYRE
jgi:hypothetical protein